MIGHHDPDHWPNVQAATDTAVETIRGLRHQLLNAQTEIQLLTAERDTYRGQATAAQTVVAAARVVHRQPTALGLIGLSTALAALDRLERSPK